MLKVGIIGLGVGEAHVKAYVSHPECSIVSICDFSQEKLDSVSEELSGVQLTQTANDILHDPDINLVSIASYDNYHHEQITTALINGKHVFVEKPLCLYPEEAKEIRILLNSNKKLRLSSNLILRKSERFVELKRMIEEGDLGSLYYLSGSYNYGRLHKITEGWRGKTDFYSTVYGGGVHIIDLLLWFANERIIEVSSYGTNIATKDSSFSNNDMVVSILKFESGKVGKLSCNFACVHPHFHQIEIYGTDGTFINGLEQAQFYDTRGSNESQTINTNYPGVKKGDLLEDFINSIINDAELLVTEKEVFDCMSVCFAIEESVKTGMLVKVEYL